ncbi:MAG: hypothetical protein Q8N99_05690 [Nanoarchaeota archaeon]|nr:hypothetical protein [Nanoarchaeota archaeon]
MSLSKSRYIARISYDEEFRPEVEKFLKLIYLDSSVDKFVTRNPNQRFSASIRALIKWYNDSRGPKILEENKKKNDNKL